MYVRVVTNRSEKYVRERDVAVWQKHPILSELQPDCGVRVKLG
jgi:hypothetical protein